MLFGAAVFRSMRVRRTIDYLSVESANAMLPFINSLARTQTFTLIIKIQKQT